MQKIKFKEALIKLIKSHNTPRGIALGVAIGVFIAILPLYGLHTVMVIIFAILIPQANKLAILLGTNISLPPTVATITWTAYDIGRFILINKDYPPLSWSYFKKIRPEVFKDFYYPLFLGSVILGLLCAVVFYYITLFIAEKIQRRRLYGK
ncbi:MAG: DUF2062 domain-containing protein [Candidatus Omnitrophica bacterium]|nr:DUF2062 domain-containing protein [Candidatus Omnitrophota bacterium]